MPTRLSIQGIIFDLDGTLVDTGLDFDAMRQEMALPPGTSILETIPSLAPNHAQRCWEILDRHELAGVEQATLMPGVGEFLAQLDARGIRRAVFTRNARPIALAVLARMELHFETVIAREDGPIKPDPAAIWKTCATWGLSPAEVLVLGDYRYDLEAGRNAGSPTVLFTAGRDISAWPWALEADYHVASFAEAMQLLAEWE